jgi:hypothetical protein
VEEILQIAVVFAVQRAYLTPTKNHSSIERLGQAHAKVRQSDEKKRRKDGACAKMRHIIRALSLPSKLSRGRIKPRPNWGAAFVLSVEGAREVADA